ncbi:MAG: Hpt domain-containing protein, partial [Planctomycetes bacterium]|nr:Hpt domain-containing protein [Planctomycetota bacterium]
MNDSNPLENVDPELLAGFIEEAREHIEAFSDGLMEMEKGSRDSEVINSVFRGVHTIKGCARTLGCLDIGRLTHIGENVLDAIRADKLEPTSGILEMLFETSDLLVSLLDDTEELKPQGQRDSEIDPLLAKLTAALDGESVDKPALKHAAVALQPPSSPQPTEWPPPGSALTADLVSQFVVEATDNLDILGSALLEFEKDPANAGVINSVFRAVHSIKGTADYVGLAQIKTLGHRLENVLDLARNSRLDVTQNVSDLIFEASDVLKVMVGTLQPDAETDTDLRELVARLDEIVNNATVPGAAGASSSSVAPVDSQLAIFVASAEQHIESILTCHAKLGEGDASKPVVSAMHRSVKTLINAAQYSGREDFIEPSRQILEVVDLVNEGRLEFDELMLSMIDDQIAELRRLLDEVRTEAAASAGQLRVGDVLEEQGVATREQIEDAINSPMQVGDKLVAKGVADREQVEEAVAAQSPGKTTKKPVAAKTMRVDQDKLDDYINLAGELVIARNGLLHALRESQAGRGEMRQMKDAIDGVNRITADIQDNAMVMRMIPVKSVFQRFPRMIRDLAKAQDKMIELQIYGEETELDKQVAEALGDPLVHLIRNSADHGIEIPEQRRKAGKRETGLVILKAAREGNSMVIDITDDGAGINVERLKAKAVEKAVITQDEANKMPRQEALDLIFAAGLSTADKVSDISGRGVGMDVVRTNIANLGGSVSVTSETGQGSSLRIQLPLTLAVTTVVVVGCDGETYALPMEAVDETVKVEPQAIKRLKGEWAMSLRGAVVAIKGLSELLALQQGRKMDHVEQKPTLKMDRTGRVPIIVVTAGDTRYGLLVDEFKGQQEIVVKPLANYLAQLPGLGGATIMGDGAIVLVLDPVKLFDLATGAIELKSDELVETAA